MRALAEILESGNKNNWDLAGLLHDLDNGFVYCKTDLFLHNLKTVEILKANNFDTDEMHHDIFAHIP